MEEFRGSGISVGEVSSCSLVNAWRCASNEKGGICGGGRRQSREEVRKSKVRGFGPRLERFGGRVSALSPSRVSWNRLFGIVNREEEVGNFKIVNGTNGRVLGMIRG